jgi:hypothetical protein
VSASRGNANHDISETDGDIESFSCDPRTATIEQLDSTPSKEVQVSNLLKGKPIVFKMLGDLLSFKDEIVQYAKVCYECNQTENAYLLYTRGTETILGCDIPSASPEDDSSAYKMLVAMW